MQVPFHFVVLSSAERALQAGGRRTSGKYNVWCGFARAQPGSRPHTVPGRTQTMLGRASTPAYKALLEKDTLHIKHKMRDKDTLHIKHKMRDKDTLHI